MRPSFTGPALGLFELESLARGVVVADVLVKKAQVHLAIAEPTTPGKYLLVFSGPVAEVDEAFRAGEEAGGAMIIDRLFLPQVSPALVSMLEGATASSDLEDSLGIMELHTVAATLLAVDTALKRAQVKLTHLQLARGIGGKGWFTIAGAQHDVEAALEGAAAAVQPSLLVATEFVRRPHADLRGRVIS
jgi:microcompartment protein CcmL/EutN